MTRQLRNTNALKKKRYIHDQIPIVYRDLALFFMVVAFVYITFQEVHEALRWWYVGYSVLLGFFLILQPKSNPGKAHYQLLLSAIKMNRHVHYSLDKNDFLDELEEE